MDRHDHDDNRDYNVNLAVTITQETPPEVKQLLTELLLQVDHIHQMLHKPPKPPGGATQQELDALGARVQGETEAVKNFNETIPQDTPPPTQP